MKKLLQNKELQQTVWYIAIIMIIILGAILVHSPEDFDNIELEIIGVYFVGAGAYLLYGFIKSNKPPKKIHYKDIDEIDLRDFQ